MIYVLQYIVVTYFNCYRYTENLLMAVKQEINKNTANNMNCSLCTKFINILKHKPESETELKCDNCGDDNDPVTATKSTGRKTRHMILCHYVLLQKKGYAGQQPTRKVLYCPNHQKMN